MTTETTPRTLEEIAGMDTPTPLPDLLERLADAQEHLMRDHDCDRDGWEGDARSVTLAREYAASLRGALGAASRASPDAPPDRDMGWATCEECSRIVPSEEIEHIVCGECAARAAPDEGRAYAKGYRAGVYEAAEIAGEPSVYVTDDAEKVERRRTVKRIKALADPMNPASRLTRRPTRRTP